MQNQRNYLDVSIQEIFVIFTYKFAIFSDQLFGVRNVIGMHLFTLMSIGIGMRVHLAVAIVAMTEKTSPNDNVPVSKINYI